MTEVCGAPIRGFPGETCGLDKGHKGYHSCVVFYCDGCGKRRRGPAHEASPDGEDGVLFFCFLCCRGITTKGMT